MKKLSWFITLFAITIVFTKLFVSINGNAADGVWLHASRDVIMSGDRDNTTQLKLVNSKGNLKWKSSDTKIATVSEDGLVTAVSPGKVEISTHYSGTNYICVITVRSPYITPTWISTLYKGETEEITAFGTNIKKCRSSDTEVATVNKKGVITGQGVGHATIYVTCSNGETYKCFIDSVYPETLEGTGQLPPSGQIDTGYWHDDYEEKADLESLNVSWDLENGKTLKIKTHYNVIGDKKVKVKMSNYKVSKTKDGKKKISFTVKYSGLAPKLTDEQAEKIYKDAVWDGIPVGGKYFSPLSIIRQGFVWKGTITLTLQSSLMALNTPTKSIIIFLGQGRMMMEKITFYIFQMLLP